MHRECTDMLFTRTGKVPNFHIRLKTYIQMWPGEAFTMAASFKSCAEKLHLYRGNSFSPLKRKILMSNI